MDPLERHRIPTRADRAAIFTSAVRTIRAWFVRAAAVHLIEAAARGTNTGVAAAAMRAPANDVVSGLEHVD